MLLLTSQKKDLQLKHMPVFAIKLWCSFTNYILSLLSSIMDPHFTSQIMIVRCLAYQHIKIHKKCLVLFELCSAEHLSVPLSLTLWLLAYFPLCLQHHCWPWRSKWIRYNICRIKVYSKPWWHADLSFKQNCIRVDEFSSIQTIYLWYFVGAH